MAIFLAMFISFRDRPDKVVTAWDYAVGMGGAAAALLAGIVMFLGHRTQAQREQRFGESLRDQISRRIAQLEDATTGGRRRGMVVFALMGLIWPTALLHLGMRVNDKSLSDISWETFALLLLCFLSGVMALRGAEQQATARKQCLESLLKELDDQ
jgi:hypothetical protein